MPITLASAFTSEIERPHGSSPLVWLVELELAQARRTGGTVTAATVFRASSYHTDVTWPVASPDAATWYPFPFSFTPIEQNQEGDLPQLDLSVDNCTRVLMPFLHAGAGMEGNRCTINLVPASALATAYPNHVFQTWDMRVAGCFATAEAVTFRLERANFLSRNVPVDRFTAARCRWGFGSAECGYVINSVAAYTTCPKTLSACIARGNDHAARRLPVIHPRRFGGFPGIPRQR